MKKELPFSVKVLISTASGFIKKATWTCIARSLGRWSHVAANKSQKQQTSHKKEKVALYNWNPMPKKYQGVIDNEMKIKFISHLQRHSAITGNIICLAKYEVLNNETKEQLLCTKHIKFACQTIFPNTKHGSQETK